MLVEKTSYTDDLSDIFREVESLETFSTRLKGTSGLSDIKLDCENFWGKRQVKKGHLLLWHSSLIKENCDIIDFVQIFEM